MESATSHDEATVEKQDDPETPETPETPDPASEPADGEGDGEASEDDGA